MQRITIVLVPDTAGLIFHSVLLIFLHKYVSGMTKISKCLFRK